MGKRKYLDEIERLFAKSPVVSYDSVKRIVKGKRKAGQYAKLLAHNLIKQGKIKKLAKGYYTNRDEVSLAVFCFQPSYLGLQDALSVHNLWEQETIPIIITSNRARQGIRKIFGVNVMIRRINKNYLFGFEYYKDGDFYFPYSDIEKTFIDLVYFRQPIDKEVIKEIKKRIDRKKLFEYLERYPERFRKRAEKVLKSKNAARE